MASNPPKPTPIRASVPASGMIGTSAARGGGSGAEGGARPSARGSLGTTATGKVLGPGGKSGRAGGTAGAWALAGGGARNGGALLAPGEPRLRGAGAIAPADTSGGTELLAAAGKLGLPGPVG